MNAAVLTGDLVGSSKIPTEQREQLVRLLEDVLQVRGYSTYLGEAPVLGSQVFRGDSFQVVLGAPEQALAVALSIYASLKRASWPRRPLEARIGIGIGELAYQDPRVDVGNWTGPAFDHASASLRELDRLKSRGRIRIRSPWSERFHLDLDPALGLLDAALRGWSREQAEAILGSLQGLTQTAIARKLEVGQPAIAQRLQLAEWNTVKDFVERMTEILRLRIGLATDN